MRKHLSLGAAVALALAAASPAFAQLQVSMQANGAIFGVTSGGSVSLTANAVGQAVAGIVSITGATQTNQITSISVTGSSAITQVSSTALPSTSASVGIQYLPATATSVTAQVSIFTGNNPTPAFTFSVVGTTPNLTLAYSIPPNGALTALNSGSSIVFPATNLGSSSSAVVTVLNSGSASGSVSSATVSGSDYQITSSAVPTTVAPGQQVSLTVTFTPHGAATSSGTLTVGLNNATLTFPLTGSGSAPNLVAQYAFADNNAHSLVNGAILNFPAVDSSGSTSATLQITNQGTGPGTINSVTISGAGFQLNGLASLPVTVPAGQGILFRVVFAPGQAGTFSGTLNISMSGATIAASLSGSTASSNFLIRYVDPTTNNVLPLSNNATLSFPNTTAGASSTITMQIANTGAGTGSVDSVILSSGAPAFLLLSLPPLPISVPPNQQAVFAVRFSPAQQQNYSGSIVITLNGQATTINLSGQATQAQYSYTWSDGANTTTVAAGGSIPIAGTNVGQTTSIVVTVSNTGSADGQIAVIGVTGQGFSLSGVPALPVTLHAGASQHFTLNFAPTQPVAVSGVLTIGGDTFTVSSTGIGAQLIYSYTSGSASVPVAASGVVLFPPLTVGSSESLTFSIQNTGTAAATVSTINLTAPSTVFALSSLPALPLNLAAGAGATFTATFSPNNTGSLTATLQVNTSTFTLSGNGLQPAALPSYQFQGPSGAQQPAQQPSIGLTLAAPYSLPVQGALTMTFVPAAFADDSSIQFASGGRTVNFTIAAGSTQALFNGGSSTMPLQTGTTAGNIVITPSFSLPGGFSLTPPSPAPLTLTIAPAAPQLLNAGISAETTTSFTLTLSGFTTSRVLRQLSIQISTKPGQSISNTSLTIDLSSTSATWFQSTVAQASGGSFLMAIPFTLSGGSTGADLVHMLQSLSITATNDVGTSSALSVAIP